MSLDWSKDVAEFHKHLGYENYDTPEMLTQADLEQRTEYLDEEVGEFYESDSGEEAVDALIDLIYFAVGTLLRMGVDPRPAWDEVHRANMDKEPKAGEHKHSIKPEGWRPPALDKLSVPWRG
jgi:predicted HAD superfamily Cof-like phosphohydrolase